MAHFPDLDLANIRGFSGRYGFLFYPLLQLFLGVCCSNVPAYGAISTTSVVVQSLDGQWRLATDSGNQGREQKWFLQPRAEAVPAEVPWIIQDPFPSYHGIAWYWREFVAPLNPHEGGRALIRFWAVDYKTEVWVNGLPVGGHEGGEAPFVLDVTQALKPGKTNHLVVRVLNPSNNRIDGIVLRETPARNKAVPYSAGNSYDHGGIVDSVELLLTPPVHIEDVFVHPDVSTGVVQARANLRNASARTVPLQVQFAVSSVGIGQTMLATNIEYRLPPGDTLLQAELRLDHPRLWELSDPQLYRVTVRASQMDSSSFDERSVRCGFRDFRFENGYFRLNHRRIFLRCSHTGNHAPIGLQLAPDSDFLRRDLINMKFMGFNMIRFIAGVPTRQQLDLCDEIGLLVYQESYASWLLGDSPQMKERFDRSTAEMIRRDRNHPCIVMWGLLNETVDGPVFRHAVESLPLVRSLDDSRLVMLNSGRFDNQATIGSLSNPGSTQWENLLHDQHPYPRTPHTEEIIKKLRSLGGGGKPVFISEYGVGSAVDLLRVTRHYERWGKASAEDALFYRDKLDRFLSDWVKWRMADVFGRPEDFFMTSVRRMAGERLLGLNAIRSNPDAVGHSLTGTVDQGMSGEGVVTTWRELKPGTADALFDAWAPLRWCLFAEPTQMYRGQRLRVECVLANEDQLAPGVYPARAQIFGPTNEKIWERLDTITIPPRTNSPEPPLASKWFSEEVEVDGPAGRYRVVATLDHGGAPMGGEVFFHVGERMTQAKPGSEVVLWGDDEVLSKWCQDQGLTLRPWTPGSQLTRQVILAGMHPPAPGKGEAFSELLRQITRGSTAIFLSPQIFAEERKPLRWLPLAKKGTIISQSMGLYHKDEWARRHAIFEGLPTGMMDYLFYRDLIPDQFWSGLELPAEVVCAANNASADYSSGILLSVHSFGAGRFILNTLRLRENAGQDPAADRLLRNLLRYAESDREKPLGALPADFDVRLKDFGYD